MKGKELGVKEGLKEHMKGLKGRRLWVFIEKEKMVNTLELAGHKGTGLYDLNHKQYGPVTSQVWDGRTMAWVGLKGALLAPTHQPKNPKTLVF